MADPRLSKERTLTIADEGTVSTAAEIGWFINASIAMVTTWTSAAITFQGSNDGVTFYNIYDSTGTEVTIPAATHASRAYELPAAVMNFRFIKIRSGTTASPVTQSSGPYTITVCLKS